MQILPPTLRECHTIINHFLANVSRWRDGRDAICSAETCLTYAQLDDYSIKFARYLIQIGFQKGDIILCRHGKSPWAIVSFLGILRAGLAFTPVDPSYPAARVQQIANQTNSRLILELFSYQEVSTSLESLQLDAGFFRSLVDNASIAVPDVQGTDLAYVFFTSGSTGEPKGVMVDHKAICSSLLAHGQRLGMHQGTRALQATSYTFDPCLTEIFATLIYGGCVCVPTGWAELAESINRLRVNWAFFTPSVISLLAPEDVPSLTTVAVGGEALTQDCVDTWSSRVKLFNSYGPTEACVFSCISSVSPDSSPSNIGYASGCHVWVVDAENHNRICAVGEVGELVIQGDILARGYLGNAQKTAEVFVRCEGASNTENLPGRIYKTGDLAKLEPDGSISCLGRKDRQVKIQGQRVELRDIESHILQHSRDKIQTVVVEKENKNNSDYLVAFLILGSYRWAARAKASWDTWLGDLKSHLSRSLPSYMVPDHFVPMETLPKTSSGKADRAVLLEIFSRAVSKNGQRHARDTKDEQSCEGSGPALVSIKMEVARVLSLDFCHLDSSSNFFQLGGNSLLAIKLVARLRRSGIQLPLKAVLDGESLATLATSRASRLRHGSLATSTSQPFHDLGEGFATPRGLGELGRWAADQCGLPPHAIESILPCTAFQESLLPSFNREPCAYVTQYVFKLPPNLDLDRFKSCWAHAYNQLGVLRTRILLPPNRGPIQVIVDKQITWDLHDELSQSSCHISRAKLGLGGELSNFALYTTGTGRCFVLTLHHVLFDEWSLQLLLDHVAQLYDGKQQAINPGVSFDSYVHFSIRASRNPASKAFWQKHLDGFSSPSFPTIPRPDYQPELRDSLTITEHCSASALLIEGSLALALGTLTGQRDVCFGTVMSGRDAGMPGIDEVLGPTVSTLPFRIAWDCHQSISEFVAALRTRRDLVRPHEQLGIHNIAKVCPGAANACDFQTMLVIQAPSPRDKSYALFQDREETENRDSHSLVLECTMTPSSLVIDARFDPSVVSAVRCRRLLHSWTHMLRQMLEAESDARLASLSWISGEDLATLGRWNESLPPPVRGLIHDILPHAAQKHPRKTAVESWDGSLTYSELDDVSSRLAAELVAWNPTKIIALHFPKGISMVVSMWAVLKAGRAFLPLDIESPGDRVTSIITQLESPLVLSHDSTALKRLLPVDCWTVNKAFLSALPVLPEKWSPPEMSGHDLAYVIMTSGSTGRPKGVMIEHQSVMTHLTSSAARYSIDGSTRILQFASVAFDMCVYEVTVSALHGACLCVPPQGVDADTWGDFVRHKNVNWSFFTPSFLRSIKPANFPSFKTIIVGGEAVTLDAVESWAPRVNLLNVYGPTECTITCMNGRIRSDCSNSSSIGKAMGSASWIVDPEDHNRLMPLGAVGELLIEGFVVGRGYMNDADKTAAAFILPPSWASPGQFGRDFARMYKTGDLACYDDTGSLVFVGRKDNQIKLRGQRLELAEVEHHVEKAAKGRQSLCFVPHGGPMARRLIAVISAGRRNELGSQSSPSIVAMRPDRAIRADIQSIRNRVSKAVPGYMVPSFVAVIREIPIALTGKADRKAVGSWIQNLSDTEALFFSTGEDVASDLMKEEPTNNIESALQSVWAEVLNISADKIGMHQSFQSVGGDSITAMQAVARCRNRGICITMKSLLQASGIRTIGAEALDGPVDPRTSSSLVEGHEQRFPLSPLQKAYVALAPQNQVHHFNQTCQVMLRHAVDEKSLQAAMRLVVKQHASLRTRYNLSTPEASTQRIADAIDGSFSTSSTCMSDIESLNRLVLAIQSIINPVSGPIIHCELVSGPEDACRLILVATHLAVDIVSWRLILEDLEAILEGKSLRPVPPGLFRQWCKRRRVQEQTKLSLPVPNYNYWAIDPSHLTYMQARRESVSLSTGATSLCLGSSNNCLRTKPTDLFIAALLLAFCEAFPDRDSPAVCLEGHGRRQAPGDPDISGTVGWFTAVTPVYAPYKTGQEATDFARKIKDARFWAERNHADFFGDQQILDGHYPRIPEIMLNFTGVDQEGDFVSGGMFTADPDSCGDDYDFSGNMRRFAIFDVAASVRRGRLRFEFLHNQGMSKSARVKTWISAFLETIEGLAAKLAVTSPLLTQSDYPNASLTYAQLQCLELHLGSHNIATVACNGDTRPRATSVFAATPIQEQILHSQQVNPYCWRPTVILAVTTRDGSPVNMQDLLAAWRQVITANPILRTIFVPKPCPQQKFAAEEFLNVVLDEACTMSSTVKVLSGTENLLVLPPTKWRPGEPQHRLTILPRVARHAVLCRWEVNHALMDHGSMPSVLAAFSRAYAGEPSVNGATCAYQSYATQLDRLASAAGVEFWQTYLQRALPSRLTGQAPPNRSVYAARSTFATPVDLTLANRATARALETANTTTATVFRLAWARVVATEVDRDDVVLGFVVSGRDAQIDDIDRVVGPTFNIMPCRVTNIHRRSTKELLQCLRDDFLAATGHQHSLARYLKKAKQRGGPLFDSVVNFRRHVQASPDDPGALVIEEQPGSQDPYELQWS
ncbi:Amino acid adenylation [Metarhizium album ARSEF 1941]|uniref:Amino acid adenylation n=1 Tax=Metarhizium album (strain ARSEF 1941) TaxID=1081103 RepID=A0A0B2WRF1_METAS|nr:Amino acid adenylation [Metarhizium album ARSEF 1941]KHN96077.1 Amino acid adenylation [Metarhizium album ARSEF 1941]